MNKKQKKTLLRILLAAIMMIILSLLPSEGGLRLALFMIPYLTVGYDILKKALKGIQNRQVFDENFLMAVATAGAILLGDYKEGVAVMLFYQVGELFQSYAVGKSRRNISDLMDIRPDYANVERDGELEKMDPDEVEIGTVIVVRPGEKVPIDGVILEGKASLDASALTGESLPREVEAGNEVISGCIDMTGVLKIQTTKAFGESTVSRILELIENSSSRKSKSEDFISKFARYYTPAVCSGALALALIPPLGRMLFLNTAPGWGMWALRALTFLVISCPCALVISIPLSFFAGIGGAGKAGVLVKGSNYLETLSRAGYVVFDKTGTLTKGVFEVVGVHHNTMEEKKILEYAALAESFSSHPISRSLKMAYAKVIDQKRVANVEEVSGNGITAVVDGISVAVGNAKLMDRLGIAHIECSHAGTIVHVAIDGAYAGHILISDVIKPNSKEAITRLKEAGVRETLMLTGDGKRAALQTAGELGIDKVYSDLLPADKVRNVEAILLEKDPKKSLVFVGDGINDAPVLSRADVGIAMGALGSDAAIEAADVVLMDDDPLKIVEAIKIAKKCMRIVHENIYFALGIKLICLILGAVGIANMWIAIFADVGVMVLAVLNAIRALFTDKPRLKRPIESRENMAEKDEMCCDTVEVHEDLLKIVNETTPAEKELSVLAELFKVFGDSTRIRILFVLLKAEVCVCDLAQALNMGQSAISHQLRVLKQNRLVKSRREGKSIFYSLADEHVRTIIAQGRDHIKE